MGDPAVDTKVDPLNVEGLEDIFAKDGPQNDQETTWTVLDQTEQNTSSVQDGPGKLVHPISVEEAANILKISPNAVCKRLRKGSLLGNKIPGKFKDEWLVEGAGLIEVLSIDVKQKQDSSDEAPPENSTVQDQTTHNSRTVQEGPNEHTSRLLDLVEKQAAKLEAAAGQIGYLQAQLESQTRLLETKESQIKLLTDTSHPKSIWARLASWFTSART